MPVESGRLEHIPALDGLRALAVGLVIAYHLDLGLLPGGFLGVDLFFVLSGFLITTLLVREFALGGRIDFAAFWLRRARRLLPALFLLVAVIAAWAATVSPYERDGLRLDLLSVLAYVTNWRFIAAGTSYFTEFTTPSPVRHLWSLAIEEQFYLAWPLLALGGLALATRRGGRAVVVGLLVGATLASVVAQSLTFDVFDPSPAYFATHTRAHELLIGALGALAWAWSPRLSDLLRRAAPLLASGGLVVVVATALLLTDGSDLYYRGGSTVFSLAALALILGVALPERGHVLRAMFSLRPLVWLGMISYGLYLWHWPVIVWLSPAGTGLDELPLAALRVGLTVAIAGLSFLLLERPIRRGRLGPFSIGARRMVAGSMTAVVALGGLSVATTRGGLPPPEFVEFNRKLLVQTAPGARATIGFVGDSTAMSLYPGLAMEALDRSLTLVTAAFPGCPVGTAVRVDGHGRPFGFAEPCPEVTATMQERMVAEHDPVSVVWLSVRERFDIGRDGVVLQAGSEAWRAAAFADWDATLERLTRAGARVVLVLPLQREGADPRACRGERALAVPKCVEPNLEINVLRHEYRLWADGHRRFVTIVDPDDLLCPADPCPARLGDVDLFTDGVHLTPEAARLLARDLLAGLEPALLGGE
jgi:peptidoglycan/LPS O-acetylase OafA/YrhL